MARFTSVSISASDPPATRTLTSPASGMSSNHNQVLAAVMSGSLPADKAIARAACAASSGAARRNPAGRPSARVANPMATRTPPPNNATAVVRSGSRPPIKARSRSNR